MRSFLSVFAVIFAFTAAQIETVEAEKSSRKIRQERLEKLGKAKKRAGLKAACPKGTSNVKFGILWKPKADSTDSRRGKPVLLLTGTNKTRTSSLKVFSSSGETICNLSFKAPIVPGTNSGADHYWSGWPGGCGKTASQMSSLSSDGKIYVQWKGKKCIGPINPASRIGRIV